MKRNLVIVREAILNICKMMESIKEQALENNINSKNFNLSLNDILSYSTLFLNGKVERLVLNFVFYVRSHLENIKIKDEDKIKTSYNVLKDFKVTYEIGQVIKL